MALDELDNVWVTELLLAIDVETGLIVDAMGEVEACLGLTPQQMIGLPLIQAVHRDDLPDAHRAVERARSEGRATWEGRVRHIDGSFVDFAWEGRLGTDGATIYARTRDAARARETLANLRVFERLADLSADVFIVLDGRGHMVGEGRSSWRGRPRSTMSRTVGTSSNGT